MTAPVTAPGRSSAGRARHPGTGRRAADPRRGWWRGPPPGSRPGGARSSPAPRRRVEGGDDPPACERARPMHRVPTSVGTAQSRSEHRALGYPSARGYGCSAVTPRPRSRRHRSSGAIRAGSRQRRPTATRSAGRIASSRNAYHVSTPSTEASGSWRRIQTSGYAARTNARARRRSALDGATMDASRVEPSMGDTRRIASRTRAWKS